MEGAWVVDYGEISVVVEMCLREDCKVVHVLMELCFDCQGRDRCPWGREVTLLAVIAFRLCSLVGGRSWQAAVLRHIVSDILYHAWSTSFISIVAGHIVYFSRLLARDAWLRKRLQMT